MIESIIACLLWLSSLNSLEPGDFVMLKTRHTGFLVSQSLKIDVSGFSFKITSISCGKCTVRDLSGREFQVNKEQLVPMSVAMLFFALQSKSEDPWPLISLASLHLQPDNEKALNTAIDLAKQAKMMSRNDWMPAFVESYASYFLDKFDDAYKIVSQELRSKKDANQLYFLRAMISLAQRRYKQAKADATKAINLNPKYFAPYHVRATCLWQLGDHQKALIDCNIALSLAEEHEVEIETLRIMHAKLSLSCLDYERAISDAESLLKTNPKNLHATHVLIEANLERMDFGKVELLCTASLIDFPNDQLTYRLYYISLIRRTSYLRALMVVFDGFRYAKCDPDSFKHFEELVLAQFNRRLFALSTSLLSRK